MSTIAERQASEHEIRTLIERWAAAIRAGDLDAVLADHSDDIRMFDVPPPNEVRGIDAYRETWPPFFEWLRQGAAFEIVSLEVTKGSDVAFATALLRCGKEEELKQDPDFRLRLTVGLRKERGPGSSRTSTTRSRRALSRPGPEQRNDEGPARAGPSRY